MKKKWTNIILPAILMLWGFPAHAAVQIGSNAFPDAAFRTLVQSFDTDHDGVLSNSEIASVTEIDCEKNTSIRDVTGIACFTSLKSLNVWKCPLSKLDVSKNYQLEYLDCCETGISSLDVTSNPDIHQLWCYGNSIAELDLTNNSYLLKAYSNGVYKNDTYISYADEETISYIALDKTVKLKLPSGIKEQPGSSSEEQPGSSSEEQPGSSFEEQPGTTPAGTGHTVAVGETISFDREATIPGDFLEQAFKVDCEDIVSITQARTGNINYADGTTYYFSIWITGVKPGTTSVTVYDNSKTIKIWSTTVTVYGDDVDAEEPAATEPTTDTAEKTDDTVKDAGGTEEQEDSKSETKQDAPKVDTKLTHSGSGLIYTVTKKGKEVSLKGISKKKKIINIPKEVTLGGTRYKVTAIASNAFKGNKNIQEVTIGNKVTKIGEKAFSGCTSLKKVKGGNGVTSIKGRAFYGCSKLSVITIGSKVTSIEDRAFAGCASLKKINIPASVKSIGKEAFLNCKKLSAITIKTTKLTGKKVGKNAFKGTATKATVKVPKKVKKEYKVWLPKKGVSAKAKIIQYN